MTRLTDFFGGNGIVRKSEALTSGTSWTVPANLAQGVVVLTMIGGGGAGSSSQVVGGQGGAVLSECIVDVTPGASISYSVGAGGDTFGSGNSGGRGIGSPTTFGSKTVPGGSSFVAAENTATRFMVGAYGRQANANNAGLRGIGAGKYGCYAPNINLASAGGYAGGGLFINADVYGTGGLGLVATSPENVFSRPGVIYLEWVENIA